MISNLKIKKQAKTAAAFKLRSYQLKGVAFLVSNEACLLADEMGLGKSVQAIIATKLLINNSLIKNALIVCPASLTVNWENELLKWAPELSVRRIEGSVQDRKYHYMLPVKIYIASYEQIRMDIDAISEYADINLVILDEAQRIKNKDSKVSLACRALPRKRSWALTGTPLENSPDDLVSIFSFLRPGLIQDGQTLGIVHKNMQPHFMRRTKSQVLKELPPIIEQTIMMDLTIEQKEKYHAERSSILDSFGNEDSNKSSIDLFSYITRLKLICNFDPDSGASSKMELLSDILNEKILRKEKVVVFSQYVKTLNYINGKLETHVRAKIIKGSQPPEERIKIVNDFNNNNNIDVLLISLKAGGVGLNINEADSVVLFDRWWNPAVEDQAVNRAHRFGKKSNLHAIKFLVRNTVEEKIQEIIRDKINLKSAYIDAAKVAEVELLSSDHLLEIISH